MAIFASLNIPDLQGSSPSHVTTLMLQLTVSGSHKQFFFFLKYTQAVAIITDIL